MDKLDPEVRQAVFAIQKDLIMNVSIHQFLVSKLQKCGDEFIKNDIVKHKNEVEKKIKVLDQKQKQLLANFRSNNLEKSSLNLKKEEKPTSPQKLIDYRGKRRREEEFCSESFKKKKSHKKVFLFPPNEKPEDESKVHNCFSEEEEAKLRSHGCFYVFSQQTKLTRPLTEQDYFLMNFGLVSRDHIQYAPYDVASHVRRTRRQLGSKPKYKASEWETTSAKKLKPPKGKGKEAERTLLVEPSVKAKPIDNNNSSCPTSNSGKSHLNSPVSEADLKITNSKSSRNKGDGIDSSSKLTDDEKVVSPNFQMSGLETTLLSSSQKVDTSVEDKQKSKESPFVECHADSENKPKMLDESRNNDPILKDGEILAQDFLNEKESKVKLESEVFLENNASSLKEPNIFEEPECDSPREDSPLTTECFKEEVKTIKLECEEVFLENSESSEEESKISVTENNDKSEISKNLRLMEARFPSVDNGCFQCDSSIENADLASTNEGISSQDSGISMRSNASETELSLSNSCSNIGFPSIYSEGLVVDNDSSDNSASLTTDLLLPDSVMREQVNMV